MCDAEMGGADWSVSVRGASPAPPAAALPAPPPAPLPAAHPQPSTSTQVRPFFHMPGEMQVTHVSGPGYARELSGTRGCSAHLSFDTPASSLSRILKVSGGMPPWLSPTPNKKTFLLGVGLPALAMPKRA